MNPHPFVTDVNLAFHEQECLRFSGGTVTWESELDRLARLGLALLAVGSYEINEASNFYELPELKALANHPAWLKGE